MAKEKMNYPNHEVVVVDNGSEANDVEVYGFTKEFGKSAAHKYGLIEEEGIYICSKPNQEV